MSNTEAKYCENSEAICHCALKWDLQSGQQNPQYSQKKKTKTHTHTHTHKNKQQIAQVKGVMNLPSSLCLQGTESISNF